MVVGIKWNAREVNMKIFKIIVAFMMSLFCIKSEAQVNFRKATSDDINDIMVLRHNAGKEAVLSSLQTKIESNNPRKIFVLEEI